MYRPDDGDSHLLRSYSVYNPSLSEVLSSPRIRHSPLYKSERHIQERQTCFNSSTENLYDNRKRNVIVTADSHDRTSSTLLHKTERKIY